MSFGNNIRREITKEGSMTTMFPVVTVVETMLYQSVRFVASEVIHQSSFTVGMTIMPHLLLSTAEFVGKEGTLLLIVIIDPTMLFTVLLLHIHSLP